VAPYGGGGREWSIKLFMLQAESTKLCLPVRVCRIGKGWPISISPLQILAMVDMIGKRYSRYLPVVGPLNERLLGIEVRCQNAKAVDRTYPQRTSRSCDRANGSQRYSNRIAASALHCAHRRGAPSPQAATRPCFCFAALAAFATSSPVNFKNRARSNRSLTINAERVPAASSEIYLPCSIAVATSRSRACNFSRRLFRCDSVARTMTAFPALRGDQ